MVESKKEGNSRACMHPPSLLSSDGLSTLPLPPQVKELMLRLSSTSLFVLCVPLAA